MDLVQCVFNEGPAFHGKTADDCKNYAISRGVCDWIADNVAEDAATLETGCGYSTIAFISKSRYHAVISPFAAEHDKIRHWCTTQAFETRHVDFIAAPSQVALPQRFLSASSALPQRFLEQRRIDVYLIDGDHCFPAPQIDWYYVAEDIQPNGFVLIDDTQIVACKLLRDFLEAERGRWKLVREIGKTAIFQRTTTGPVLDGVWWAQQPYNKDLWVYPPTLSGKLVRGVGKLASAVLPDSIQRPLRAKLFRHRR